MIYLDPTTKSGHGSMIHVDPTKMDKIGVKMHNYLRKALIALVMVHSDALFN